MNDMKAHQIKLLEEQIATLEAQKTALLEEDRKETLSQLRKAIQTFGFSAIELGFKGDRALSAQRKKRDPIYRNPHNHDETWAGGARPRWVQAFIANGGNMEDCRISPRQ